MPPFSPALTVHCLPFTNAMEQPGPDDSAHPPNTSSTEQGQFTPSGSQSTNGSAFPPNQQDSGSTSQALSPNSQGSVQTTDSSSASPPPKHP
ncbi:hypothetical protein ASPSYDRAFT_47431 [Aspergillus sydowii CBS 593.65]|uniref:Uncharacterized protein n=1 Tax=Aspergillus sydowii CBS 593.65 TaxID=1036612 RepID=A0A1L9TCI3_9EURO|nr:uncharacterized protein ASPSYDRAFT_47431 [Aspergillus sydowii CBS 593.65]OJJ57139.1 hypothetical protein ASPSYDRAFT_47431 [Aspergillus sydowii CBS 593.65]